MKAELILITTMIMGRKKYIIVRSNLSNGKNQMEYTDFADNASEFDSEAEAAATIDTLHNPLERELAVETVIVEMKPMTKRSAGELR